MDRTEAVRRRDLIILNVKPSCTIGIEVWKLSVIAGNAGRYMSVTNGPNAVSEPRSK